MSHQIKDIIIYPIKGMSGIHLTEAKALPIGFEHDRRWMLIDQDKQFITQRSQPIISLFKQQICDGQLSVTYKDSTFSFLINQVTEAIIETKVWDDIALTHPVSRAADEWFSHQLGQNVKLVKISHEIARLHYSTTTNKSYSVSLADGYPYLIIGEESLRFLNEKMSESISMSRFRPNIVITSFIPHEEDHFKEFKIGSAKFLNIKPCGRCSVITIDQDTAITNNETLKVLNTYRKKDNNVLFGTNVVCNVGGTICVGDTVEFL